jgi:hypothetical protein
MFAYTSSYVEVLKSSTKTYPRSPPDNTGISSQDPALPFYKYLCCITLIYGFNNLAA